MNKIKYVSRQDDVDYYIYSPSVFSKYWFSYEKDDEPDYWKNFQHSLRMLKLYLFNRYKVLYIVKDNITVGHIVISFNIKEIKGSEKSDIIIGPKWVAPRFRGKGYGTKLLQFALNSNLIDFSNAYEMISISNISSIRVVEKCGYEKYANARKGRFGKILIDENGSWFLYKYVKDKR